VGGNTISASAANQGNTISANATSGFNNIEAKNNNVGVATANSVNTVGNAGTSTNLVTGATNSLTASTRNTMTAAGAFADANLITATVGGNTISASAANQGNTISANATSGFNNIEAKTNNIGVATAASINNIGHSASSTNTINGVTGINASINAATNINTGTSTSAVSIGNSGNYGTNNVNAYSGNTTMSLTNNVATLKAGSTLASNGSTGVNSGTGSGGLTIYNTAQTIAAGTTIPTTLSPTGILTGKTYQNKINGNLLVDGNVYINGTLDYVSSNTANTTVIGSTSGVGASVLAGATAATTGGTAIVMKGATGTQTVVDANGKITNVVTTATQSTAALTLTNGIGNTHGLVVTESQATLSGGTRSSSLTMGDNGATFSDAQTGAPVQVQGVNDGTKDFDAVNVRQFAGAIASVVAMANIPQVDQDKQVAFGMALGSFMGKTALAAGVTYRFTRNGVLKGSLSSALNSSHKTAVGVGAAWSY
jgi:hypothetical protein